LGERLLEIRKIGARSDEKAVDVEQRVAAPRVTDTHSLQRHGLADQLRDAGPGRTTAEEQEALVRDFLPGDTQRGKDARQCDAGGALYVVVIGADLVAIAREDRNRVDVCEVFPLDAALWVQRLHCIDELVDEGRVFFAANAVLPQPEIERVIE
jgi:hypothetical protein